MITSIPGAVCHAISSFLAVAGCCEVFWSIVGNEKRKSDWSRATKRRLKTRLCRDYQIRQLARKLARLNLLITCSWISATDNFPTDEQILGCMKDSIDHARSMRGSKPPTHQSSR